MSAGPWEPHPLADGLIDALWRMMAIAAVWFGVLGVTMLLTLPDAPGERPAPGEAAWPQAEPFGAAAAFAPLAQAAQAAPAAPPRARTFRHAGSVAAPATVP